MKDTVIRRSPRSPAGEQRSKIPVVLSQDIEDKIRADAKREGITLSFLLSRIIEAYYGKRSNDNPADLLRRIERLENAVFSHSPDTILPNQPVQVDIPDTIREQLIQVRDDRDLTKRELADAIGFPLDIIQGILDGNITQILPDELKKIIEYIQ